jgi:hypothetical protein
MREPHDVREPQKAREPNHRREPADPREPPATRAGWPDDEPREAADRPAVYYAPAGECLFCDRRREAAAASMRRLREKGEG